MTGKTTTKIKDFNPFGLTGEGPVQGVGPTNEFCAFRKQDLYQPIFSRFQQQVETHPDKVALVFGAESLTYDTLNRRANQVAHKITELTSRAGPAANSSSVALLLDYGISVIVGIMGVLKAGKIYVALDCSYPAARVKYMLQDSKTSLILTDKNNFKLAVTLNDCLRQPVSLVKIEDTRKGNSLKQQNPVPRVPPGHIAYIMYTSGSTGIPKGVAQTHRNVLHFIKVYTNHLHISINDRLTMFSSYSYDASVMDIFGALLNGATLFPFIVRREGSLDCLPGWLKRERITIYHSVPTLYRYFIDNLKHGDTFPGLRLIVLGGEPVYRKDVEKYKSYFPGDCLFLNLFGSTESSISLLFFMDKQGEITRETVPLGVPVEETGVLLVDENNEDVPVYGIGEMVCQSPYLALGYLNRPEETASVFVSKEEMGGYRTGDLGRRLPDGSIEYINRKDFQVKVRGYRIGLAEIENALDRVDGIKKSVVLCWQDENRENYLVAFYIKQREMDIHLKEIIRQLKLLLPDYMIPGKFVGLKRFPLTSTGKLDRKALLALESQETQKSYTPPADEVEEKLVDIWAGILKLEKEKISSEANFFDLGGQSFKAIILLANIHKTFDVKVSLAEIFNIATVKELAQYIRESVKEKYAAIVPVDNKDYYVLSSAQKRLYILHQMAPESTAYNVTGFVQLEGYIDVDRLEQALSGMIHRHESFRTSFHLREAEAEAVQKIQPTVDFYLDYEEAGQQEIAGTARAFIQPFDLTRAPLLRAKLVRMSYEEAVLMIDMHHIITDGTSMNIFYQELMKLYEEMVLESLYLQYKDYSQWRHSEKIKESLEKQERYWLTEFETDLPVLELPTDYPRPRMQSFEGSRISFEIGKHETSVLRELASSQEVTLYMVSLAIFYILLSKLSGDEDIIVGAPTAGRGIAGLELVIGIFVNTLALRNFPHGQKFFNNFLRELKQRTLDAFENQDYQFEDLVEKIIVRRDISRNPLFDTMFVFQNQDRPGIEIPGLSLKPLAYGDRMAKFDITLMGMESEDNLYFSVEYSTKLFRKKTIERFIDYYINLVARIPCNPGIKISEIEIISGEEKKQLLTDFNNTGSQYPGHLTIHGLFQEQVERSPDHVALVAQGARRRAQSIEPEEVSYALCAVRCAITYRELDERSNQLAYRLKEKGVKPNTIVAIMVERSIELIVGILGILKSGGAYLPIDPGYPRERIDYILADSAAKILLTVDVINRVPTPNHQHLFSLVNPPANSLAYVIYTSGSTGRPKGVLVEHRGLVNYIWWAAGYYLNGARTNFPLYSSISFDLTVTSIFTPLITGSTIIIYGTGDNQHDALPLIQKIIEENRVDIVKLTPSHLKLLHNNDNREKAAGLNAAVKRFIVGGEAFGTRLARDTFDCFGGNIEMYNEYGPTEAVVGCMIHRFHYETDKEQTVSIGCPINNTRVYILDRHLRLVPPGTAGELYIASPGLARGYLNRPGESAEKFLENPYITGERLYRSGDLVRWRRETGDIEFLGRVDNQVKIRGYRIELGEIENRLANHDQIKESVVLAVEKQMGGPADAYLCAYIVPHAPGDTGKIPHSTNLREYLSRTLPDYMIPACFVQIKQIPLTANGKVDREALPDPEQEKPEKGYVAPGNEIEQKLVEIWSHVLRREKNTISADANFFQLGGHSLNATIVLSRLHKVLDVGISLVELFKRPTIRELAAGIRQLKTDRFYSMQSMEKKEYYPLSSAQKRLYILQRMNLEGVVYNIPLTIDIEVKVDRERMEDTLNKLVDRHESLRTSFHIAAGIPVQAIHDDVNFQIEYYDMKEVEEEWTLVEGTKGLARFPIKNFIRPFDLSAAPLLRVGLIRLHTPPFGHPPQEGREQKFILMLDMHHIITDGVSLQVLLREFTALNKGEKLNALKIQYKDFSLWQNRTFESGELKKQEQYWLKTFENTTATLNLPIDYERPQVRNHEGSMVTFEIGADVTAAIKKYAESKNVTLFMLLLAVYYVLLAKIGSQEDIVVGTAVAGRKHADLEQIIGMFANTLALRNFPSAEKTFSRFLEEVKQKILEAFDNQDYPFEELVDKLKINRDMSHNPLFDVMFGYQTQQQQHLNPYKNPGMKIEPFEYENRTSKFDMILSTVEEEHAIVLYFKYSTKLFKKQTIQRFATYFKDIVVAVGQNSNVKLKDIEISLDLVDSKSTISLEAQGAFGF